MPSAATLRQQIELELHHRIPAALSPTPRALCELAPTGIPAADRLLDGGFPVGAITQLTGPASSGRTTLALSFLAQRTAEGRVCAWVDAHDALDPESAAASGVALDRLLWVRCNDPARKSLPFNRKPAAPKPWTRLDQALRATDLLLQAGGFAAIVLDLASAAPEHASRIPLATWFRFRQAADRTRCSLLVLGQAAYAQSSAEVALDCLPLGPETLGNTVVSGFRFELSRARKRFSPGSASGVVGARKPPASTWQAGAAWDTEKRA